MRKVSSDGADLTCGGRLFQTWGPATGKALSPTVDRLDCGRMRRLVLAERRAPRLGKSATRTNGPRYDGAQPWRTLYVSTSFVCVSPMHACRPLVDWHSSTLVLAGSAVGHTDHQCLRRLLPCGKLHPPTPVKFMLAVGAYYRTGKVRRSKTIVLPQCHTTFWGR